MTVTAWRIVKARHARAAFNGQGARIAGGRWNSPGHAVVYVAGSASLAMLEMLVHLQNQDVLRRYVLFDVTFDSSLVQAVAGIDLPRNWRSSPPPAGTRRIGDQWLQRGDSAVLRVPSALVPDEFNYLLNPAHKDFEAITIGAPQPVRLDPRLARMAR